MVPLCTTELGYMAKAHPAFDSPAREDHRPPVDSAGDHLAWAGHRGDPGRRAGVPDHRRLGLQASKL